MHELKACAEPAKTNYVVVRVLRPLEFCIPREKSRASDILRIMHTTSGTQAMRGATTIFAVCTNPAFYCAKRISSFPLVCFKESVRRRRRSHNFESRNRAPNIMAADRIYSTMVGQSLWNSMPSKSLGTTVTSCICMCVHSWRCAKLLAGCWICDCNTCVRALRTRGSRGRRSGGEMRQEIALANMERRGSEGGKARTKETTE